MNPNLQRRAHDMMNIDGLTDGQRIVLLQSKELEQDDKINKHHKILIEGNGELPLVERVRNLEKFIDSLKFWLRTVAVALVLQTLTFGASALIYFVKLYPILQEIAKNK